jgi:Tol biopolymer transport system component
MIGLWLRLSGLLILFSLTLLSAANVVGQSIEKRVIAYNLLQGVDGIKLFILDVNREMARQLVDLPVTSSCCLTWSPDGKTLAFLVYGAIYGSKIFLVNADGSNVRQLTQQGQNQSSPAWSPDGSRIVFLNTTADTLNLSLIDVNTGRIQPLETTMPSKFSPSWSPDGTHIMWQAGFPDPGIYTINLRTDDIQLLNKGWNNSPPQYSPDGEKIVFASLRGESPEIYVMNADGTNLSPLTDTPATEENPRWSPDGQKILFTSNVNGAPQVFIMAADGNNLYQLTHSDYVLKDVIWSPDGQQVLYTSMLNGIPNGTPEFYIINLDSSAKRRLTFNSWYTANPAWQP